MMVITTAAVLIDPARMAEANAMLMMYGSLSALVDAYLGFSGGAVKSYLRACIQAYSQLVIPNLAHFTLHRSVFAVVATTIGYGK